MRSTFLYISTVVFIFVFPFFSLPLIGWNAETSKVALFVLWGLVALIITAVSAFADRAWRTPFRMSAAGVASAGAFLVLVCAALLSDTIRISFFGDGYAIGVPLFMAIAMGLGLVISRYARDARKGGAVFLSLMGGMACTVAFVLIIVVARIVFGLSETGITFLLSAVGKWNDLALYGAAMIIASLVAFRSFMLKPLGSALAYLSLVVGLVMLTIINLIYVWTFLLVITVALFIDMKRHHSRVVSKAFVCVLAVTALISLAFSLDNHFGLLRGTMINIAGKVFNVSSLEAYPSFGSTYTVAKGALGQSPVFGFGPGRFSDAWKMYRPQDINFSQFWSTDFTYGVGAWPTFIITTGIVGALGMLAFIIALFSGAYKLYRKSQGSDFAAYMGRSVACIVMFFTAIFFVYSPGWTSALIYAMFIGLMVGLSYVYESSRTVEVTAFVNRNTLGLGLFIAVIAFALFSLWSYGMKAYAMYEYGRAVSTSGSDNAAVAAVIDHVGKAFSADHRDLYARSLGSAYYVAFNSALVGSTTSYTAADFQNMLNSVINVSTNAVIANPYNSDNYIFVGELFRALDSQNVSGAEDQAESFYKAAKLHDPYNPLIPVLEARLAFQEKDADMAKQKLKDALDLKPNYTEATFLLSQILVDEGVSKQAIAQLESRAKVAPAEPIVFFQLGFLKYAEKDYKGAIPALEAAVSLVPSYSNALYFLGLSYYYEDRDADAIAAFQRIVSLNPGNADAASVLANMKLGKAPYSSKAVAPEKRNSLPVSEMSNTKEE